MKKINKIKKIFITLCLLISVISINTIPANAYYINGDKYSKETINVSLLEPDNKDLSKLKYGIVLFEKDEVTEYINADTGASGYIHGNYGPEAAFIGMQGDYVLFKQAAVNGKVHKDKVYVVDYDKFKAAHTMKDSSGKPVTGTALITSRYHVDNGRLYHDITTGLVNIQSSQIIGNMVSGMQNGKTYYSYDGHYFYTDYKVMLDDYRTGTYKNSINSTKPYYSYYQYLSHRSKSNFTAAQINEYINTREAGRNGKMSGTGQYFIDVQNTYGVNAILMLGVAINESGWGSSEIAMTKNNLFGHGAVDSNPLFGANGYATVRDGIIGHGQYFLSNNYLAPWDWKYYGPNLGDKLSGINVKYASDPYWGEKAAAHGYLMENYFNDKVYDQGQYTIAVGDGDILVRGEPTTKNGYLYSTAPVGLASEITKDFSFVVLDTVKGESVKGNDTWYKVQCDTPLTSDRSRIVLEYKVDADKVNPIFNFERDYGYVHSLDIDIVSNGAITAPTFVKGDVNGDGQVRSNDNRMIKDYILDKLNFNAAQILAGDVNGDGQVRSNDYRMIKDYILGKLPNL